MKISRLGDLKQAYLTYSNNGRYGKRGLWSVARGGYDLWFEVYYDNIPIVDCTDGELENIYEDLSIEDFDAICQVILSIDHYKVNRKYGYDIICHKETNDFVADHVAGDNGDMEFDSAEAAIADAEDFIPTLIADEYQDCTRDDFEIEVVRIQ